jgi:CBS domain-containing protein
MMIGNLAQPHVVSVGPTDTLDTAITLMEEHRIRHLPVIDVGRPVGMVSDRDLLLAVGWKLEVDRSSDRKKKVVGPRLVREIMSSPALYLDPGGSPQTASRMMAEGHFHALLILRNSAVSGLVTSTDLLRYFATVTDQRFDEPVEHRMRANVRTIGPSAALFEASRICRDAGIRHLPVAVEGSLIGLVTDRDLRRVCGEDTVNDELAERNGRVFIGATRVMEIMTRPVQTISEDTPMRVACQKMATHHIGCLPVTRDEQLIGILTDTDCLRLAAESGEPATA